MIRAAWHNASRRLSNADYIEAHGAGTLLGDVIEAEALHEALGDAPRTEPVRVGSVKTNIGHCEAAAGVAGLIKVALSMYHDHLPPSLHFQSANPQIPFERMPFRVQQTATAWPTRGDKHLAGVSSFGFGGANVHVVLESAEPRRTLDIGRSCLLPTYVLPLSAARAADLGPVAAAMHDFVSRTPALSPVDLCLAAATRREPLRYRLAIDFATRDELLRRLQTLATDEKERSGCDDPSGRCQRRSAGGAGLCRACEFVARPAQPMHAIVARVCREDRQCDTAVRAHADWSVLAAFDALEDGDAPRSIECVHTCLFSFQVSLAAAVQFLGVRPNAVTGHSMGEVAAAHIAGALSLDEAVRVVVQRSRAGAGHADSG